jgi:putative oxidoreductase
VERESLRKDRKDNMAYGILLLRIVIGGTLFAHGTQKLFGWFGGHGPRGTAGFFGSLGFRPALPMAVVAGLSEAAGLLFALGFLTPFAALAMASVMVVAVGSVHLKNGFWAGNGGYEYNLALWTVAVAVAAAGPGRFSLDHALGWAGSLAGLWWGVGVAAASLAGGAAVLALRETQPVAEDANEPLVRDRDEEPVRVGR